MALGNVRGVLITQLQKSYFQPIGDAVIGMVRHLPVVIRSVLMAGDRRLLLQMEMELDVGRVARLNAASATMISLTKVGSLSQIGSQG